MRLNRTFVTVAFSSLIAALAGSSPAFAHAKLMAATPSAGATVREASKIELRFNEEIVPKFSKVELKKPGGKVVKLRSTEGADRKTLAAEGPTLTPGSYKVAWSTVSTDDGHRTHGTYTFNVK